MTRPPTLATFAGRMADNHSSMPATVTVPTASGAEAVCPETRVKALDVLSWPRVGVRRSESLDRRWENRPRYDGKAVGTVLARFYDPAIGQFLTVDPDVGTTLSPYGYVAGDPLNATDPTGLCVWIGCWVDQHARVISAVAGTVAAVTAFVPGLQGVSVVAGAISLGAGAIQTGEDIRNGAGVGTIALDATALIPGIGAEAAGLRGLRLASDLRRRR